MVNATQKMQRLISICTLFGFTCVWSVQFLEEPEDMTKTYTNGSTVTGDSFLLHCQVDSLKSDQKVSWFKNGEIISDGYDFRDNVKGRLVDAKNDRYRILPGSYARFFIQVIFVSPSTAEFDSGTYQCAVTWSNDVTVPDGKSRNATVNIFVTPAANYPICGVHSLTGQEVVISPIENVRAGDELELSCLSGQSTPIVHLFWSRNDQGPLPSSRHGENDDGLYYISHNWTPSGNDGSTLTFTCTLQHPGLSSDRTCSLNFKIQYAPIVTINPSDVMVTEENDEIVLHCNQDANPQVTESVWYYDDDVVNSGGRFRQEGMSLRILTFRPEENGSHTITCQLTNAIGAGRDSVILTVSIPFSTARQPRFSRFSTQLFPRSLSTTGSNIPVTPNHAQTMTISIWLGVGLLFIGIFEGVLSTVAICFLLHKYGRMPWRYDNKSNTGDGMKSGDGMELKDGGNLGMDKEKGEQNYEVIQKTESTTVKSKDEREARVTDTTTLTNISPRQKRPAGEDEQYQSLGKRSGSLYTVLTFESRI